MSPTPVTLRVADQARLVARWEATNEAVAARYGLPVERVVRFDTNTSPAPPELAGRVLAAAVFEVPLSEYPPSDYRRLIDAAAARYGVGTRRAAGRRRRGRDPRPHARKAFLPPGGAAVVPVPTYAMYGVLTEQRGARSVACRALGPGEGYALDVDAVRAAAPTAATAPASCGCAARTTRRAGPEPEGAIAGAARTARGRCGQRGPARADRRPRRGVHRVRGRLARRSPGRLSAPRRRPDVSKAYALAGLRVGFAIARPELIEEIARLSAAGLGVQRLRRRRGRRCSSDAGSRPRERRRASPPERERLRGALRDAGWIVAAVDTNFVLVAFAHASGRDAVAEGLLRARARAADLPGRPPARGTASA